MLRNEVDLFFKINCMAPKKKVPVKATKKTGKKCKDCGRVKCNC